MLARKHKHYTSRRSESQRVRPRKVSRFNLITTKEGEMESDMVKEMKPATTPATSSSDPINDSKTPSYGELQRRAQQLYAVYTSRWGPANKYQVASGVMGTSLFGKLLAGKSLDNQKHLFPQWARRMERKMQHLADGKHPDDFAKLKHRTSAKVLKKAKDEIPQAARTLYKQEIEQLKDVAIRSLFEGQALSQKDVASRELCKALVARFPGIDK